MDDAIDGFIARDITFENTAGPQKHQAVALRSDSDRSVFNRCQTRDYQDTLYAHTMRQFYRDCKISSTVDLIFGDATVVFKNCKILAKKGYGIRRTASQPKAGRTRMSRPEFQSISATLLQMQTCYPLSTQLLLALIGLGSCIQELAGLGSRVKCPATEYLMSLLKYTVAQFIEGNLWLPTTDVKYTADLGLLDSSS
ncbi:hypothetical protein FF1_026701 [Malus domestica]